MDEEVPSAERFSQDVGEWAFDIGTGDEPVDPETREGSGFNAETRKRLLAHLDDIAASQRRGSFDSRSCLVEG